MNAFCKRSGIDNKDQVEFWFKGRPLEETDTPKLVGLKSGDNIEIYDK